MFVNHPLLGFLSASLFPAERFTFIFFNKWHSQTGTQRVKTLRKQGTPLIIFAMPSR
jgi:hypothetical protein